MHQSQNNYMWILKDKTNGPSQYDIVSLFDVEHTGWSNLHTLKVLDQIALGNKL